MVSWRNNYTISTTSNYNTTRTVEWLFDDVPFVETPNDYEGFVYVIHNPTTERYYIGQKRFWTTRKLPPLKGRKNRRHRRIESDWRNYWGSSEALHQDIELYGTEYFSRNILQLCTSKGELNYVEAKLQFEYDVLFDPHSYNGIINCKIHRSHLSKKG
jgi:hypothetical protein